MQKLTFDRSATGQGFDERDLNVREPFKYRPSKVERLLEQLLERSHQWPDSTAAVTKHIKNNINERAQERI